MSKRNKIAWMILLLLPVFYGCKKEATSPELNSSAYKFDNNSSSNIKLCVYLDDGVFDVCKTNTVNMLKEMDCNFTAINKDSILNGSLSHYNLLLMPGGDMWEYSSHLSSAGMEKIREFVHDGGGYLGICGGSYFAANQIIWRGWANEPRTFLTIYGLNLFPATADGPIEDFAPTYVESKCKIAIVQNGHPILENLPPVIEPYYDHGPKFIYSDSINITALGRTVTGNKKIILSFKYGSGKIFLIGAHPEADNSHVSWVIVKNALIWCSE